MVDKSLIKIKRSAVSGNAPDTSNIVEGELALNTTDRILYSRGGDDIFEVGANVSSLSIGGTEIIDSSGVWQGSSSGIKGEVGEKGQKGQKGVKGQKGDKGQKGQKGLNGLQGNFGGASFEYGFTQQTAPATGPLSGIFKITNANALSATTLYISDEDKSGTDIQSFLRTIDDSTSTIKGHIRISQTDDSESYVLYTITSVTENTTYFSVSVSGVSGTTGTGSFSDANDYILSFVRTGDLGDKGEVG
ncbi:hypothetical protein N9J18_00820, partial [Porticoccaceae bacterium]|nr:hypothetical protein [Porticoccaceae bacterium]